MDKTLELTNLEIWAENCTLDVKTGKMTFYRGDNKAPGFTGLYFRDDDHFLAIYPTETGPMIFFEGKEYAIHKDLSISLLKQGKDRKFKIAEYNIEIDYLESPYIGFDVWSDEIDVDLFFMIEQSYKEQGFYDDYTLKQA